MSKSVEILKLQETMHKKKAEDSTGFYEPHLDHYFSDGLYGRLMTIEAGSTVVGHKHKQDHIAIVLEGKVAVSSKYGTAIYEAPYIIMSKAEDKRAVVAITQVKWLTVHATSETDVVKLKDTLTD